MSNTAIIEISGTKYSKVVTYKTQIELWQHASDFAIKSGYDTEDDVQVNVYDPEYSLEVCMNKFYV